ncbi:MAG: anthranilate synthase subunit [Myxococcaceae bacterium]|nr:anthranilate synthase subunit [Myxococcaceae bacterium]
MTVPFPETYQSNGGVRVRRVIEDVDPVRAVEQLATDLDARRGALLTSSYEYPGRYTRWDLGFVDPPVAIVTSGRALSVEPLNSRGELLVPAFEAVLQKLAHEGTVHAVRREGAKLLATVAEAGSGFTEEQRTRVPSIFSVLRALVAFWGSPLDKHLGLYGAFGYDLTFQFDPVKLKLARPEGHRDMVLYLPDELLVVDHMRETAELVRYDFEYQGRSTVGLARTTERDAFRPGSEVERECDHVPGEYERVVDKAKESFKRGDLFEVVPGQVFFRACKNAPSAVFRRLRSTNPSPYGFYINLGQREYLVGASPEMFVRVSGERVETCPISGTIARGGDAIADARQILALLNSQKDASELTMCTDVDRNDKSRVCRPETVRVIGRRQIEMYSKLIHTVDHVEGMLRPGYDALDAFVTHTWAVTVTGAPKLWAMQFIEDNEKSVRAWYGGAVGKVGFDGGLNTGLTLRTIRIRDGVAQVRAGATLLYDSDPVEEERETRLKASALLEAIELRPLTGKQNVVLGGQPGAGKRILFVDHQDSFVHTLAGYFRRTGAEVTTLRAGFSPELFDQLKPDLVVMSPGPGSPRDFDTSGTIAAALARNLPIFGVCLGLQALIEHFGGELGVLSYPMHGKPSEVSVRGGKLFEGIDSPFVAGRYHSLHGVRVPDVFDVTAVAGEPEVVMAIEHKTLPIAAVQFHPESILTADGDRGLAIVHNCVRLLARSNAAQ